LNGLLLSEIARAVLHVVKDPRTADITITTVKVSRDLRHARVYFSLIGDRPKQDDARRGLQSASGLIKRELSRHLKLKHIPDLEFIFDDSLEHAEHIDTILKGLQESEA
jgi:ribosome-binding factor A